MNSDAFLRKIDGVWQISDGETTLMDLDENQGESSPSAGARLWLFNGEQLANVTMICDGNFTNFLN